MSVKRYIHDHKILEPPFAADIEVMTRQVKLKIMISVSLRVGRKLLVLPDHFEIQLVTHIKSMEAQMYVLTTIDFRRLPYELAER